MPVFISHRTQDDNIARGVYAKLNGQYGIQCYLDDFDQAADPTDRITQTILNALEKSTHLFAIITDNTRGSWWVPYEVGVAQHGARRIASYDRSTQSLPEYLKEWPVLNGDRAIDEFAVLYKSDAVAQRIRKGMLMEHADLQIQQAAAAQFHATLKQRVRCL